MVPNDCTEFPRDRKEARVLKTNLKERGSMKKSLPCTMLMDAERQLQEHNSLQLHTGKRVSAYQGLFSWRRKTYLYTQELGDDRGKDATPSTSEPSPLLPHI